MDELRNWQANFFTAIVYKTGTAEEILKAIRSRLTKAKKTWWQKLFSAK